MLKKLLIANRGEIARRIIRTARKMGIATVAVYSDADRKALHVRDAGEAVHIGASLATESYLRIDKIIAAAKSTGADAIHPGYGFLSENADLPEACLKAGITFVGPRAEAMRALGGKAAAKEIAIKAGVPVVPGYQGKAQDLATLAKEAKRIGYPVMIKAVAGGGGRGMRLVEKDADFAELLDSARREAQSSFGNPDVLIEKLVVKPRHIEVQVFGDTKGNVVHLFERDCTLQRRNQKVIEEAPAPGMSEGLRAKMCDAAVKLAKSVNYEGAGTVEFLVEGGVLTPDAPWYFIEMNTRLQVEHPVTEEITGLDLVEWQLRVAAGEKLPLAQKDITMSGHAIEVRLCAEDPAKGFMPSVGRILCLEPHDAQDVRWESGVVAGDEISPFYDSMIVKIITKHKEREHALSKLSRFMKFTEYVGPQTNGRFLRRLLEHPLVIAAKMDTGFIAREMNQLSDATLSVDAIQRGCEALLKAEADALDSLASVAQSNKRRSNWEASEWDNRDSFQLGGTRAVTRHISISGRSVPIIETWSVPRALRDAKVSAKVLDTTDYRDGEAENPLMLHTDLLGSAAGRQWRVVENWVQVTISHPTYDASDLEDAGDGSTVRAPITGRVAKIFVKAGDAVEKGQRLAVVEAMKMEHVLMATGSGTVETIAAVEGAQVVQGALIVGLKLA